MKKLILASSSKYREALLKRLQIPFIVLAPNIDESSKKNEKAQDLSKRLAYLKAKKISEIQADDYVIGSDQVLECENKILGKPLSTQNAKKQLLMMNGKNTFFYTSVCLINRRKKVKKIYCDVSRVKFRKLTEIEIKRYLSKENALDCAGSAKFEELGVTLLSEIFSNDPTAIEGLPLLNLTKLLRKEGFLLP